jgi:hypothetical protein
MTQRSVLIAAALAALAAGCPGVTIDGPPEVEIGAGLYEFAPVVPGEALSIDYLLQGGAVLYVALRIHNMQPRDAHVDATITFSEDGTVYAGPLPYTISFKHRHGEWVYAGLPVEVVPEEVRGLSVIVDVEVTDRDGRIATDAMEVIPQ